MSYQLSLNTFNQLNVLSGTVGLFPAFDVDAALTACEPINTILNMESKGSDRHIHKYPAMSQVPMTSSQSGIHTYTGLFTEQDEEMCKEAEPNLLLIAPK